LAGEDERSVVDPIDVLVVYGEGAGALANRDRLELGARFLYATNQVAGAEEDGCCVERDRARAKIVFGGGEDDRDVAVFAAKDLACAIAAGRLDGVVEARVIDRHRLCIFTSREGGDLWSDESRVRAVDPREALCARIDEEDVAFDENAWRVGDAIDARNVATITFVHLRDARGVGVDDSRFVVREMSDLVRVRGEESGRRANSGTACRSHSAAASTIAIAGAAVVDLRFQIRLATIGGTSIAVTEAVVACESTRAPSTGRLSTRPARTNIAASTTVLGIVLDVARWLRSIRIP
jgi:hypothetical protein